MTSSQNLRVNPGTGKIEHIVSREFEDRYLELLYQKWDAKDAYHKIKNEYKIIYLRKRKEIEAEMLTTEALIKNFSSTKRGRVKDAKKSYKSNISAIHEEYNLGKSEIRIKEKNAIEYRRNIFEKEIKLYQEAIKKIANSSSEKDKKTLIDLQNEKTTFEKQFYEYDQQKSLEEIEIRNEGLKALEKNKQVRLLDNQENYRKEKNDIDIEFSKSNYEVLYLTNTTHKKELKKELKNQKKIYKESVKKDKGNILKAKKEYILKKEEISKKMNELNLEKKEYIQNLKGKELNLFKRTENYVKSDLKSVKELHRDEIEKLVFKKVNPAYVYILPAVFGALFFTLVPFIFMLVGCLFTIDLTNIGDSVFVGFNNFINIFLYDVEFQKALYQTLIFALITIVLLTVITTLMAAWLAKNTKIHNLTQTMVFTPHIASLLSVSILWIALLEPQGVINTILGFFGIKGPSWLIDPKTSLVSVAFVTVWKSIGYYVLIIIAGLQNIPAYVYEAAKLDKAKKSTTFFKVTLPLLSPTLAFTFIIRFINCFKVFASIEVMTNGGPLGSSMVLSYWIYKVGRIGYNYGTAMAGAVVLTLIIGVATFVQYRFFNKKITYQ